MVFHFAHTLQQMLQLLFQQCVLAGHSSNGYVGYVMPTVCICSWKIAVTETDLESSETQDWTALHLTKPGYAITAKMSAGTTTGVEMLFRYISVEKDHAGVVVRIRDPCEVRLTIPNVPVTVFNVPLDVIIRLEQVSNLPVFLKLNSQ
ncbi:hypothetical protein AKJ16_DCAP12801 [Drosera capensis]